MAENQRPDGLFAGDRHYDGPGLGPVSVWKCPACATENVGEIDQGCSVCGSGSARPYKATPPPADLKLPGLPTAEDHGRDARRAESPIAGAVGGSIPGVAEIEAIAEAWVRAHDDWPLSDAFIAGYRFALQRTLTAPPVSTDLPDLSPEGKVTRTIIAALELFRDQVLRQAAEEIASGEWCSLADVDQLLQQLRAREGGSDEAVSL
jgi:hypothetical protein